MGQEKSWVFRVKALKGLSAEPGVSAPLSQALGGKVLVPRPPPWHGQLAAAAAGGQSAGSGLGKAGAVPASSRTQRFPLLLALFVFLSGLPPPSRGS